jgi:hypothetical protein
MVKGCVHFEYLYHYSLNKPHIHRQTMRLKTVHSKMSPTRTQTRAEKPALLCFPNPDLGRGPGPIQAPASSSSPGEIT